MNAAAIGHVLGYLVAGVLAVVFVLALCVLASCMLSSRISAREAREAAAMLAERRAALFAEADPIESYPSLAAVPVTPLAPIIVVDGPLPGIANPLTNRYMTPEIRQ